MSILCCKSETVKSQNLTFTVGVPATSRLRVNSLSRKDLKLQAWGFEPQDLGYFARVLDTPQLPGNFLLRKNLKLQARALTLQNPSFSLGSQPHLNHRWTSCAGKASNCKPGALKPYHLSFSVGVPATPHLLANCLSRKNLRLAA